jgi:hypothetical protein
MCEGVQRKHPLANNRISERLCLRQTGFARATATNAAMSCILFVSPTEASPKPHCYFFNNGIVIPKLSHLSILPR